MLAAPHGRLRDADGKVVRAEYALVDGSTDVEGHVEATDPVGLKLVRVGGPLVLPVTVTGIYADTWSGKTVTYRRLDCDGGKLTVNLGSDPSLFTRNQVVTAFAGGRQVGRATIPPAGSKDLIVPLARGADGACTVKFVAASTAVPVTATTAASAPTSARSPTPREPLARARAPTAHRLARSWHGFVTDTSQVRRYRRP